MKFFERYFLFAKIWSIQLGFLNCKNVDFLIKHSKPNEFIKSFVLDTNVEIANQYKLFILTDCFLQEKKLLRKLFSFCKGLFVETNT